MAPGSMDDVPRHLALGSGGLAGAKTPTELEIAKWWCRVLGMSIEKVMMYNPPVYQFAYAENDGAVGFVQRCTNS